MNKTCTIFTHIPKTGGASFINIIKKQFRDDEILLWCKPEDYFMRKDNKVHWHTAEKIECIQGHIPFGIHAYLPMPATYVTFLRDPIKRVFSDYKFWYWINNKKGKIDHIDDIKYFCEVTGDNLMTRFISGLDLQPICDVGSLNKFRLKRIKKTLISPNYYSQCPPEMLEIAKQNLREHFSFIGITEKFDESLLLLKNSLGWKNIFYYKTNVAPYKKNNGKIKSKLDKTISKKTLKYIKESNQLDIELYSYATSLFEDRIDRLGKLVKPKLNYFQFWNPIYSKFEYTRTKINKKLKK